jgi:hypothetical protein
MVDGWMSRREVVTVLNVEESFVLELESEAIVKADAEGRFDPTALERIRLCHTLHDELGVNLEGLEVALQLIDRIHAERTQFRQVLDWLRSELAHQR